MSIILACDPGSIRTGWACIHTDPLTYIDSGFVELGTDDFWGRIGLLKKTMIELTQKHSPSVFVLEKAFVSLNKQTALKLSQIRGALMALCHSDTVEYAEYTPREIKMQITGYGAASKEQVALMIRHSLGQLPERFQHSDESDAIAIALCHAYTMKHNRKFLIPKR